MIARLIISLLCISTLLTISSSGQPVLDDLEGVAWLPRTVPQRVGALAFDGKKLWFAIYQGRGSYATYDPASKEWDIAPDPKLVNSIAALTGQFRSPGGMAFVDGKLWVSSSYGESFGAIDLADPSKLEVYNRHHDSFFIGTASQAYSDLAYDGTHLWAAWHAFYYRDDGPVTQRLLKIDKETGKVVAEYPIKARSRADGTHALAWDGRSLWHAKNGFLTQFDQAGAKRNEVRIDQINRPSGMAWDGSSLWIAEFGGKLWRLPFARL